MDLLWWKKKPSCHCTENKMASHQWITFVNNQIILGKERVEDFFVQIMFWHYQQKKICNSGKKYREIKFKTEKRDVFRVIIHLRCT